MWFWWFSMACAILLPLMMIVIGRIMRKNWPSNINNWSGYRTSRSMKNQDTWRFANSYFGKQCGKVGWILLPSALVLVPAYNATEDTIGIILIILELLQGALLFYPVMQTEQALKNTFHEDGTFK